MDTRVDLEPVKASELLLVEGGIWDYSNRLGDLGAMLEARQDRNYGGVLDPPTTLDGAAKQALQGWVSIP